MWASACCSAASLALAGLTLAGCAAPPPPRAVTGGAPARVVSLNLCTDELLLLLGAPEQIGSVTHLSHQSEESPLWRAARRFPANDGTMASAAALRPGLVLTMGGGGGDRAGIAGRLGIPVVDIPYPERLDDIVAATRTVARALGREAAGVALTARIEALRRSAPATGRDTVSLAGGGRSVAADGLAAEWMALAGLDQRPLAGDRVELEDLLVRPPAVLLRSDYRERQYSRGQSWLAHPLARGVRGSRAVVVPTDGRRWTCMGPLLLDEIERLRARPGR